VLYQLSYRPAFAVFFKDAYIIKEILPLSTKNRDPTGGRGHVASGMEL